MRLWPPEDTRSVPPGTPDRPRVRPEWWLYAAVATVAFVVRLVPVLIGGGLTSYGRYDDGVYYAAADALTFGRVPYRDFALLHPPGLPLVLTPFAWLGRVTSDSVGMAAGRVSFMVLGAVNAVLVALVARRWGRVAAVTAGGLYACWQPAVYAEGSTLLEPAGTTAVLLALLLLGERDRLTTLRTAAAGAALGFALTLKIWNVAPVLVIVGWTLLALPRRAFARVVGTCVAVAGAVLLPFYALTGSRMYRMVVSDQFARSAGTTARTSRLTSIFGAETFVRPHSTASHPVAVTIMLVVAGAAAACVLAGWLERLFVLLLGVDLGVLLSSPAYFAHYAELTAAPIVLVAAVGLTTAARAVPKRSPMTALAVAMPVVVVLAGVNVARVPQGRSMNWARLAAAAPPGCIASDSPEPLIQMNRLTADLVAGCALPIDVSGYGYDLRERVHGHLVYVSRARNPAWQAFLYRYLTGARAFVLVRGEREIMPAYYHALVAHHEIARAGPLVLRAGD